MRKKLSQTLLFIILFTNFLLYSQTKIYNKNSKYSSDILYTINNGKLYKSNSNYSSDILFTIKED